MVFCWQLCICLLSLFDSQAVMFHNKLDGFGGDPRVVVGTNINPKIVGGKFPNKINIDTVCVLLYQLCFLRFLIKLE